MNKIGALLAAALVTTSCGAAAGDYSDAVAKQSRCESAGRLAQSFYGSKTEDLRAAAKDFDSKVRAKAITKQLAEETKYILFLGNKASSPSDAYMQGWAFCMDRPEKK